MNDCISDRYLSLLSFTGFLSISGPLLKVCFFFNLFFLSVEVVFIFMLQAVVFNQRQFPLLPRSHLAVSGDIFALSQLGGGGVLLATSG